MNYDGFICYATSDRKEAQRLVRGLIRYRIPSGLGPKNTTSDAFKSGRSRLSIFLPEKDPVPRAEEISQNLRESAFLVVLCSPASAKDPEVDRQVRAFKRLDRPLNILTLILDGEPNAADGKKGFDPDQECFPEALKYEVTAAGEIDRARRVEPVAADARPNKDGRQAARLKIIAGLLGVGFDDLYQREERRQSRRVRVVVAGSLVLTVLLGILTVRAFLSEQQSRTRLANTREVNSYIESLFANVDRPALQKMDSKLMSLILDASATKLDQTKPPPAPDLEAQMRQILGQAYLACGLWDKAVTNLQRSLKLGEPLNGAESAVALATRRDLGEALIGAGKSAEAKDLLSQTPAPGLPVVRYELARALALTGDTAGADKLLSQEFEARPQALAQAQQDPAFASIRSALPAPTPAVPTSH